MELNFDEMQTLEEMENDNAVVDAIEYNRVLFSANPVAVNELVKNVFERMLVKDEEGNDIMFYQSSDNCIKWSTEVMAPQQIVLVEGLLSHRLSSGLLQGFHSDEAMTLPVKCFPANHQLLQGTVFMGGIKSDKQLESVLKNVVEVANIPIVDNPQIMNFVEPVAPGMEASLTYVLCLYNLTVDEMTNLKRAAKVRKTADKTKKLVNNLNTTGYALTKAAMDDIAVPLAETAGKLGGVVAGGVAVGGMKGGITFGAELLGSIADANIRECESTKKLIRSAKEIGRQLGAGKNADSFNFTF